MRDVLHSKVWYHGDQAALPHQVSKTISSLVSTHHPPMKYDAPIVAAEIQAREVFGFSSLSSKAIIN